MRGTLCCNYFSYTSKFSTVNYAMNECNRKTGCTGFSKEGQWWILKKGRYAKGSGISYIK